MIPVSQLFKNYAAMSDRAIEAKAIINGVPFLDDAIVSVDIEESILNGEELAFGSALSSKLTLKLFSTADVAKNAEVKIEIRMNGADGYTEWVPYGTFYVDERVLTENVWTFTCYDLLIKSNQPFETQLIYPTSFGSAFLEILVFLGATVEENTLTLINGCGHQIPYKDEDLTVNEMLSYMAASLGGFFVINKFGKLELRKLGAAVSQGISKSDYVKFIKTNSKKTLTKAIVLINKSSESIELGTGQDEDAMTLLNPWAFTEASIKASILAAVVGLSYTPIDLVSKGFLYLETGDKIEISEDSSMKWTSANGWSDGNIQSITTTWIGKQTLNIKRGLTSKYLMTGLSNNQSEFKFKGGLNQRVTTLDKTVVKKETAYYGVTIGKDKGIQVEKSDRSSELLLNSDVMAWKIKDTLGNMVDRLYLDSVSGELEFNGKLGVDAIEALKAEIDVVISNTVIINQLSAQKGNIAELTVDQLETSDKVQKYLVGDKTDVNYIKVFDKNIEFITAEVADATGEAPVTPTVQLKDRNNAPIFWLDDTHTGTTLDVTAFPVMIYVYTEAVKLKMAFDDSESKIPKISFGQGVGNPTYPDRGKGFVYKDTQGLVMEYLTEAGVLKQLRIGEDGVLGDIVESLESLNFYTNGFKAEYGNRHVGYRWTKDVSGRITQLADIYTSDVVPVVWNAGVL